MTSPNSLAEALMMALEHPDRAVREAAILEASRLVDPADLVRAIADHEDPLHRDAAVQALTLGDRSVSALVDALRDPDAEVVMFAAGVLGRSRDQSVVPHLVALLDHPDIGVTLSAIDGLSQLRPPMAVEGLIRALDRDPWLRYAAVYALGEIADTRAIPALAAFLQDEIVRDAVIEALGKIGARQVLGTLAAILRQTGDAETFAACVRAVGIALAHKE